MLADGDPMAVGRVLTDLCGSLHLEHLDTLDQGGARVVNAVEHRLANNSQRMRDTDLYKRPTLSWIMFAVGRSVRYIPFLQ
jgi:hypothetical protein